MAGTQINQNQINLGSETAIDLLAMQNGWKKEMITAMNNKIANYASEADTMNTVVQKFMGMTGNTPDTVYKVFKGIYWGTVRPVMSAMPTTSNDSWEITVCKKCYSGDTLANDGSYPGGIALFIDFGDAEHGSIRATVPVYKEDESGELEYMTLNDYWENKSYYPFAQGTKYWIKLGYNNGKYYCWSYPKVRPEFKLGFADKSLLLNCSGVNPFSPFCGLFRL
ncbi:MAG: hypothetical protein J5706_08985 [Elusimicrobiales bacterium]|nr:hypothetical protein [Elusimicrobiales bacterium]